MDYELYWPRQALHKLWILSLDFGIHFLQRGQRVRSLVWILLFCLSSGVHPFLIASERVTPLDRRLLMVISRRFSFLSGYKKMFWITA